MHEWGCPKNMGLKDIIRQSRLVGHLQPGRKRVSPVVWDSKGEEGKSHGEGKANVWCTSVCWADFNNGTQRP